MKDKSIDWDTDLGTKKDQMKIIHFITQLTRWKILRVLIEQQPSMPLYIDEIAKKINCSARLVSYQIPKMQYLGWVQIKLDISASGKLSKFVFLNSRNRTKIIQFFEVIEDMITPKMRLKP